MDERERWLKRLQHSQCCLHRRYCCCDTPTPRLTKFDCHFNNRDILTSGYFNDIASHSVAHPWEPVFDCFECGRHLLAMTHVLCNPGSGFLGAERSLFLSWSIRSAWKHHGNGNTPMAGPTFRAFRRIPIETRESDELREEDIFKSRSGVKRG